MQDYQLTLVSEASLRNTPQDSLSNCESDFTSIFGTFGNDYLKGIKIMHSDENLNTPFSRDVMMHNVFAEDYESQSTVADSYDDDEDDSPSMLGYEC